MKTDNIALPGLRVVLLNLERSVKRRENMQQRLKDLSLNYHLQTAVDGIAHKDELWINLDKKSFERNVGREVLPGEIGCYHSHLLAWQQFLQSSDEVLLVLEDDVVFGTDFIQAIELALVHKQDWDFLKLNKIRAKQPVCQKRIGNYRLNAYIGPATGFGAYLIQRHSAKKLLPKMLPIRRPIDHEVDRIFAHDLRHYGLEPFPSVVRDEQESTITGSNADALVRWPLYRRLPCYAMRLHNQLRRVLYLWRKGRLTLASKLTSSPS